MSTETKTFSITSPRYLILMSAYLAVSVTAPIISNHYQPLSGTLVNTILFLAVLTLGLREAIVVSFLPSIIAYSVGLLPKPFLVIIPVIILSNIILVSVFDRMNKRSYFYGVVLASVIKFMVIFSASYLVAEIVLPAAMLPKIIAMFGWMQIFTAFMGGLIAYLLGKLTNITKLSEVR